jgi:helix-turn-helix protein
MLKAHGRAPVLAADVGSDLMTENASGNAGGLLRAGRRKAGLTQRQLAEAAGVSVGVVRGGWPARCA